MAGLSTYNDVSANPGLTSVNPAPVTAKDGALKLEKAERGHEQGDPRRPVGGDLRAEGRDNGAAVTYRDAFHAYLRAEGQVGAMTAEERATLARGYQQVEGRAQTTSATAGGPSAAFTLATASRSKSLCCCTRGIVIAHFFASPRRPA